ncbi:hypothetical protein B0E47_11210 [Rhodanobacter sp. B05]|uniref:hypothetical protein n=1 Tax=Rhodanobacter sp. B05 TaxID=1945859 RepID=UPI0009879693|nr:hypothetical protein [Rhodanobacter sp. B05]OOG54636.1 hypothetical protein B0E47_11210 [Rhodanobacter sp. B05]
MQPSEATQAYKQQILQSGVAIQLVILGKDAFPQEPTGIAFCKETWAGQANHTCSGRYVLEALGVDWRAEQARGGDPIKLFHALRDVGVVFFNACYVKPDGKQFAKSTHEQAIKVGYAFNQEILETTPRIILCGQAQLMRWAHPIIDDKYKTYVHPSQLNGISPHPKVRIAWAETWGNPGSLERDWPTKPAGIALLK